MVRGREQTRQRILQAVSTLLLEQGFPAFGVNAIARTAGCDKVLIYRYFGGIEGLLQEFAESHDLWWQVSDIVTETVADCQQLDLNEYLQTLLGRYVTELESRPLTLEIMAWEMSEDNNLTRELQRIRSERGMQLVKRIRELYQQPNVDIGGTLGVFGAAVNYLVIRTRRQSRQYRTEEWWRLQQTITRLMSG